MSSKTDRTLAALGSAIQIYQAAVADFGREMARLLGVNETDLRCLELLLDVDELTPGDLAAALGLTTGGVTAMLDRLERLDLLTRDPHPSDRRRSLVRITQEAARCCVELLSPLIEEGRVVLTARFDASQLTLVTEFLSASTRTQTRYVEQLRHMPTQRTNRRAGTRG